MVLASGAVVAAAFLWGRAGTIHGMTTLLLFALLAFLTAVSILWSIVARAELRRGGPHLRLPRGVRRRGGGRAPGAREPRPQLLLGLLIGAAVPVAYALASRVWPAALAENEVSNRLGQPFDYWNAVGCVAAMAVPVALWLGSRRTGARRRARARLPGHGRLHPRDPAHAVARRRRGGRGGRGRLVRARAAAPAQPPGAAAPTGRGRRPSAPGRCPRTRSRRASSRCRRRRPWPATSACSCC